ncbi:MAG TPA: Ku protein, partial [Gemmatimonadales bacterium]|nr:Ku protein [Gemmatimonadales bacterium]
ISFGLVTIPVKLFGATRSEDVSFRLIHAECGTPVERRWWCPYDEEEVAYKSLVKGYEYMKGQFVLFSDQDLDNLPVRSKHSIDITAFVPEAEMDPLYFERTYYLAPDTRGEKPYALLMSVLEQEKLLGIATITIRKKQQLCAVRPHAGALLLETLFYPDEVDLEHGVDLSDTTIEKTDMTLATQLVETLTRPFDPADYGDDYRKAVLAMVDAKLEGKEVETPPEREASVIDLREALQRSLDKTGKASRASKASRRTAPARRRTRRKVS